MILFGFRRRAPARGAPEETLTGRIPVPYPLWCAHTDTDPNPRVGLVVAWQHNGTQWEPLVTVEDTNHCLTAVATPPGSRFLSLTRHGALTQARRAAAERIIPRDVITQVSRVVAVARNATTRDILEELNREVGGAAKSVWDRWSRLERVKALREMERHGFLMRAHQGPVTDLTEWMWVGGRDEA